MNYTLTNDKHEIFIDCTADISTSPFQGKVLCLQALQANVLRIHTKKKSMQAAESFHSYAIDALPELSGTFNVASNTEGLTFSTGALQIRITSAMEMTILDQQSGKILCQDYTGPKAIPEAMTLEERDQMIQEGHALPDENVSLSYQVYKQLKPNDFVYGLGDKTGVLNKRGYDYAMWNSDLPDPHVENSSFKALYKSIPFFLIHNPEYSYGIFVDNAHKSFFDMGFEKADYYSFSAVAGELDYYFFSGSPAEIITEYTKLTGRAPLPQLWTLGYHQSRWSYASDREVLDLAQSFMDHDIPCDAIHLDIDYMDNFKVFTSDPERFSDLTGLADTLESQGIKLVTIIDPGVKVEDGYTVYEQGVQNGYFATTPEGDIYENVVWPGDSVFPDFTSSAVRDWWSHHIAFQKKHHIRGIWNDMNEPASFRGPLPDDIVFAGDPDTPALTHADIHNVYGHLMAKATYEGLKREDGRRPFVITRACYSGTQKYSTAWTGDNQSLWAHLKMSIPQLLNLGVSGMPMVGTDIGGFGANTTPELMSRWIEASCFAPLFRNHSGKYTRRQEPWCFDETTTNIYRKYVKLHYRFLPYLYDLCYEETQTGLPILRPLFLHYPKDSNVYECNDEYLVGDKLLVAPITEQGARYRVVYLPEGEWIDYWTGEHISGGQHIMREAPLDICPIYVLAGSILPAFKPMRAVTPASTTELELLIYPNANGQTTSYIHYQDNGEDFDYEQGHYNLYQFTVSDASTKELRTTMLQQGYAKYQNITPIWM